MWLVTAILKLRIWNISVIAGSYIVMLVRQNSLIRRDAGIIIVFLNYKNKLNSIIVTMYFAANFAWGRNGDLRVTNTEPALNFSLVFGPINASLQTSDLPCVCFIYWPDKWFPVSFSFFLKLEFLYEALKKAHVNFVYWMCPCKLHLSGSGYGL